MKETIKTFHWFICKSAKCLKKHLHSKTQQGGFLKKCHMKKDLFHDQFHARYRNWFCVLLHFSVKAKGENLKRMTGSLNAAPKVLISLKRGLIQDDFFQKKHPHSLETLRFPPSRPNPHGIH